MCQFLPLILLTVSLSAPADGSLIFIENGNQLVQNQTNSSITHVGIILVENNVPYVYEAVPPKVRKIKLFDFNAEIDKKNRHKRKKMKIWLKEPKDPFSKNQLSQLKEYLDSQIGRKYSVGSYLSEEPESGIHCCELTGNALRSIGINYTENPCSDSPWDVWIKTKTFYSVKE